MSLRAWQSQSSNEHSFVYNLELLPRPVDFVALRSGTLRDCEIRGIVDSYDQRQAGDLVTLVDSESCIKIAVVNGSAAKLLGAQAGDEVEVLYQD